MNDEIYKNYSIIIPVRNYNILLEKCINEIVSISKILEIIIIYDDKDFEKKIRKKFSEYLNFQIKIYKSESKFISAKRNLAANLTTKKYLAFIDSDAYPSAKWIKEADIIFKSKSEVYCVGGPNISPVQQNYLNHAVGCAQKSFLVSGKYNYHKQDKVDAFVNHIPSCNMIVRKEIYFKFNCMDESLYTGEDLDFCSRINDNNRRIYFSPNVLIYHFDRGVKNYFYQKLFRGTGIAEGNQKFFDQIYLHVPFFFLIFNILSVVSILFNFSVIINTFYLTTITVYVFVCLYESLRYFKGNNYLIVFFLIFLANFFIGIGIILRYLKVGFSKKYYNNN